MNEKNARAEHWRQWGIDGMPKDKQRLADATWQAATAAAQAGVPDALTYATQLAKSLHQKHYAAVAPDWSPFDDLYGVLTQIDNMTTGLAAAMQGDKSNGVSGSFMFGAR